jgi:trans-feruloyl-CoA hydratase/vanillin synthase
MMTSDKPVAGTTNSPSRWGNNVLVEFEDGIAWVTLNRPDKRNAMSPALNDEMVAVLDALEVDDRCGVLVLTGAGDSFTAGMDLKECAAPPRSGSGGA